MQHVVRCLVFLIIAALTTTPAFAAELRLTGFIDNIFPHFRSNISAADFDVTRGHDQSTFGRSRGRMFFNVLASDDLRGVFGFEMDAVWGRNPDGAAFSFDRNTDLAGNIETKWLYVDFRVPRVPVSHRIRLGAFPLQATPLAGQLVLHGDTPGGDVLLTFTDQVALHLYYAQFTEDSAADVDRFPGSDPVGESYATGMTLRLKPLDGLDLHLPFVYGHLQGALSEQNATSGAFGEVINNELNVANESRYYLGFDARYRFGNTSIEPSFMYLLGRRKFCAPGTLVTTERDGDLVPCTSPVGSRRETDFNAFVGNIIVSHTLGPWLFKARYAYTSGNNANDDINNTGIGSRADVKIYNPMNADGGPMWQEWFEVFGNSEIDGTSIDTFLRMSESGHLDRFGWQVLGGGVEYQATDNLILEGAAGGFWTAKKPACPASLREGSIDGACGGPETASGEPRYNFTGNSRYLGWEVAGGARYTIMPGLTWMARLAYGDYGTALEQNNRKALNAWYFSNRLIYIF